MLAFINFNIKFNMKPHFICSDKQRKIQVDFKCSS